MRVGILNMYSNKLRHFLPKTLDSIGCEYIVVDFNDDYMDIIRSSPITHWILTGSELNVMNKTSPQLDLGLLKIQNKRFMLICYSMESILLQLGCHLIKRRHIVKEHFSLNIGDTTMKVFRNHHTYIVPDSLKRGMRLLATHKGDTMNVEYKNTVMTQWHPERTTDGIQFIKEWVMT